MHGNLPTPETHASRPKSAPASPLPYPDALAPAFHHLHLPGTPPLVTERKESSCQKLLFSATLTRDPDKIAALELRDPKYFVVQGGKGSDEDAGGFHVAAEKFSMPSTLMVRLISFFPIL